jgi:predicted HTH transcriptional regulator
LKSAFKRANGIKSSEANSFASASSEDGESKNLEFKQSFSKDVDTGIKEKEKSIRESSLKNIVGFLNSEGGTLLIGVKDSGEIYGVENDYYENDDKYLLNFKSNVKDHIGEDAYPFLDWKLVSVGDKRILRVDCKTSTSEPFFLNESDFYVRTNPSVDKLVGPKLANYLKERFNK